MDLNNFKRERLNGFSQPELVKIITDPRNFEIFKITDYRTVETLSKDVLVNMLMSSPRAHVDNNFISDLKHVGQLQAFRRLHDAARKDPKYRPDKWVGKPDQMRVVRETVAGLSNPRNEMRVFANLSGAGLGKTIMTILTAIELGVRHVLIICPNSVVLKWAAAMEGLGLFDYRICTYPGIVGANGRATERFARHKTWGPIEDLYWVGIKMVNKKNREWTWFPNNVTDTDPATGLGGCLVVWDEAQSGKNSGKSEQAACMESFFNFKKNNRLLYLPTLLLSATAIEKFDDLPYLMYGLGYIETVTKSALKAFMNQTLTWNFRETMGQDWIPEMENVTDEKHRLMIYLRTVSRRQGLLSWTDKIESEFNNPFTFQGIELNDDDIAHFMRINRELETMLIDVARGNRRFDGGVLGEIQKILTQLEMLKITPYVEIGRQILNTVLPDGGKPSLVIATTRTIPIRHYAWRFEAIMMVNEMKERGDSQEKLAEDRAKMIHLISLTRNKFNAENETAKRNGDKLSSMSKFPQYTEQQMLSMTMEDVCHEFVKWVYFLDFRKFVHVAIHVGNFGDPNNKKGDEESADEDANIKDVSMIMDIADREEMLKSFHYGQRRILIAGLEVSKEGIDLHDTSGGEVIIKVQPNAWMNVGDTVTIEGYGDFIIARPGPAPPKNSSYVNVVLWRKNQYDNKVPGRGSIVRAGSMISHRFADDNGYRASTPILEDFIIPGTDGSHPRAYIVSPGLTARTLIQFLGRFDRLGQTSESYGIVGFVGDIKGVKSWEAKFMSLLSKKVEDIERLHKGQSVMNIMENIEEDKGAIWKMVIDDIKKSQGFTLGSSSQLPPLIGSMSGMSIQPTPAPTSAPRFSATVSNVLIKVLTEKKYIPPRAPGLGQTPPQQIANMPQLTPVNLWKSPSYFYFESGNADIQRVVIEELLRSGFSGNYYKVLSTGIVVFRPGFDIGLLSESSIISAISLNAQGLRLNTVPKEDVDFQQFAFAPIAVVDVLTVTFDSPVSLIVKPFYPIYLDLPQSFRESKDFGMTFLGKGELKVTASDSNMLMMFFYAIKTVATLDSPQTFKQFYASDPNGSLKGKIDLNVIPFAKMTPDGKYMISGSLKTMSYVPILLSAWKKYVQDILARKVFIGKIDEPDGRISLEIAQPYWEVFNQIFQRKPN